MSQNLKDEIYDTKIHPLMQQIVDIANEYNISLVVAADVGRDDFDRPLVASTVLLFDDCHNALWNVKKVLFDGYKLQPPPMAEDILDDV